MPFPPRRLVEPITWQIRFERVERPQGYYFQILNRHEFVPVVYLGGSFTGRILQTWDGELWADYGGPWLFVPRLAYTRIDWGPNGPPTLPPEPR